jgi:hypothetical protein
MAPFQKMNDDWRSRNTMDRREMVKAAVIILSLFVAAILVLALSIRLRNAGRPSSPPSAPAPSKPTPMPTPRSGQ